MCLHFVAIPIHHLDFVHRVQPLRFHSICPSIFMHVLVTAVRSTDSSRAVAVAVFGGVSTALLFDVTLVSSTAIPASHTISLVICTATPPELSSERTITSSTKAVDQWPPPRHSMGRCEIYLTTFLYDIETMPTRAPASYTSLLTPHNILT